MARYCLQNLPDWTSLVLETLEKRQRLYHYRVLLEADQSEVPLSSSHIEKLDVPDLQSPHQMLDHSSKNVDTLDDISTQENLLDSESTECG